MKHPFEVLKPEYSQLLSVMSVRPDRKEHLDQTVIQIMSGRSRFEMVTAVTGVPVAFIGPSFYREAGLDFKLNPAQGWPLTSRSKITPRNGPFRDWTSAGIAAYRLNGLDRVGAGNWTWELICFYAELFNGMGYRDFHHMHSPYLWGGSNIQMIGKYTSDGDFDPNHWDEQLGVIPLARRIIEIEPALAFAGPCIIPAPASSGLATEQGDEFDTRWVQESLNKLGQEPPLVVDSNYGRKTLAAVHDFQADYGLDSDGLVGADTTAAIKRALQQLALDTVPASA